MVSLPELLSRAERPEVRIQVVHPSVPLLNGLEILNVAPAYFAHADGSPEFQLNHASLDALLQDADHLRQHAQAVLDTHAPTVTRDLLICLVPCRPDAAVILLGLRGQGVNGQWQGYYDAGPDVIRLSWAHTNLAPLLPVLTHELGHHLRPPALDRAYHDAGTYRVTSHLLQEGLAENLVLAVHGPNALHHTKPSREIVLERLSEVLTAERAGTPLKGVTADHALALLHNDDLYAPASELLRRTGQRLQDAARLSLPDYLERIIPLVPDLPSHHGTEDPWSPWSQG